MLEAVCKALINLCVVVDPYVHSGGSKPLIKVQTDQDQKRKLKADGWNLSLVLAFPREQYADGARTGSLGETN